MNPRTLIVLGVDPIRIDILTISKVTGRSLQYSLCSPILPTAPSGASDRLYRKPVARIQLRAPCYRLRGRCPVVRLAFVAGWGPVL